MKRRMPEQAAGAARRAERPAARTAASLGSAIRRRDSSHPCASGDLRLPSDIAIDTEEGRWKYVLNPEIGWGKTIADPKINFAGRYFLFSYDAGTMCVDWAMIDLKTGEYIDAAPFFLCPEERYKTFRVMDSRGN